MVGTLRPPTAARMGADTRATPQAPDPSVQLPAPAAQMATTTLSTSATSTESVSGRVIQTLFLQLSRDGHLSRLESLLGEHPMLEVNEPDQAGHTALHLAAMNGHEAVLELLLSLSGEHSSSSSSSSSSVHSLDTHARTRSGHYTALHLAIMHRRPGCVQQLLKNVSEFDLLAPDDTGFTPLHHAAANDYLELIHTLLDRARSLSFSSRSEFAGGGDSILLSQRDLSERTPFFVACEHGAQKTVALLLEHSPDLALIHDNEGRSPLHIAARRGHNIVCRLIVETLRSPDLLLQPDKTESLPHSLASGAHFQSLSRYLWAATHTRLRSSHSAHTSVSSDAISPFENMFIVMTLSIPYAITLGLHLLPFPLLVLSCLLGMTIFSPGSMLLPPPVAYTMMRCFHWSSVSLLAFVAFFLLFPTGKFVYSPLLLTASLAAFLYCTWQLCVRDPGCVPITAEKQHDYRKRQTVGLLPEDVCPHCEIKRPVRSQHCPRLGRCIARYHCHVSALPRPIGYHTRIVWLAWLLAKLCFLSSFVYVLTSYLGEFGFPSSIGEWFHASLYMNAFQAHRWAVFPWYLSVITLITVISNLILEVALIEHDLTQFEFRSPASCPYLLQNRGGSPIPQSPFSKGSVLENAKAFFSEDPLSREQYLD